MASDFISGVAKRYLIVILALLVLDLVWLLLGSVSGFLKTIQDC